MALLFWKIKISPHSPKIPRSLDTRQVCLLDAIAAAAAADSSHCVLEKILLMAGR